MYDADIECQHSAHLSNLLKAPYALGWTYTCFFLMAPDGHRCAKPAVKSDCPRSSTESRSADSPECFLKVCEPAGKVCHRASCASTRRTAAHRLTQRRFSPSQPFMAVWPPPMAYWTPVWSLLEEDFQLTLANARQIKPGRAARRTCMTRSGWQTFYVMTPSRRVSYRPANSVS